MKARFIPLISLLCILLFSSSCGVFFDQKIKATQMNLINPKDSTVWEQNFIEFLWEPVERARDYNFLIVSPDFGQIQRVVYDTSSQDSYMRLTFEPGNYECRYFASNAASETPYQYIQFSVDTPSSLSQVIVNLTLPVSNFTTNQTQLSFSWQAEALASAYDFQLFDGTGPGGTIVFDTSLNGTTLSRNLTEGNWYWQVRATNGIERSSFTGRQLTIDTIAPGAPILVSPPNNQTFIVDTVRLVWQSGAMVVSDSVFVYSDTALTVLVSAVEVQSTVQEYLFQGQSNNSYSWVVKSKDQAGNVSGRSIRRDFSIL